MTALEILQGLKADKHCALWISADKSEAAFLPADGSEVDVSVNDALMSRHDPAISADDFGTGEILYAI